MQFLLQTQSITVSTSKANKEGRKRRPRETATQQTHGTLSLLGSPQNQIPPAAAAAAAAPKHIVVETLGVLAETELWGLPAMMDVVQKLSVDASIDDRNCSKAWTRQP